MAQAAVYCNWEPCKALLDDSAFTLPCSHLMCPAHGNTSVQIGKCLVCSAPINDLFRFVSNPSDQEYVPPSSSVPVYQKPPCTGCEFKDNIIRNTRHQHELLNLGVYKSHQIIEEMENEIKAKTAELGLCEGHLMSTNLLIRNLQLELLLLKSEKESTPNNNEPNVNPNGEYSGHNQNNHNIPMGSTSWWDNL